jgi:multicopper oxidase
MSNKIQPVNITRRQFITYAGMTVSSTLGIAALSACGTPPSTQVNRPTFPRVPGTGHVSSYTFDAAPVQLTLGGRTISTWTYNGGMLPGPEIRVNAGDTIHAIVNNHLPAGNGTTIHWHGLPVVNKMDGVDNVTQPPIQPGQSFTYNFVVPSAGTYWYHSHVGLQLDRGLYGPLIVNDPKEPKKYDQDVVLMLDDWLDGVPGGPGTPEAELKQLIAGGDHMPGMNGMNMGSQNSAMQVPPDVIYPYYLINGKTADHPFTITVQKGQRIRLRFINASASTIYHLALQGHHMSVTHTDGQPVVPVEVDTLRIGMGERYDVLVTANNPGVWQLAAQVEGAKQMTRALVQYQGSNAAQPPANFTPPELNQRMLTYGMLKAAAGIYTPPGSQPDQSLSIGLSGGNGKYIWQINNQVYSQANRVAIQKDRLIHFQFENPSMMPHPMHLHGHFFQIENGTGRGPMKDTVIIDPMQKMTISWVSDNPGLWAFHCHNAYHQGTGMMSVAHVS